MVLKELSFKDKKTYNLFVTHVMQSWEWGEARVALGTILKRYGLYNSKNKLTRVFTITFHKIPLTSWWVGYLPKGPLPDKELSEALSEIGKEPRCAFIKVEPDILKLDKPYQIYPTFLPSPKPLFTKHNLLLDLTLSEEELLKRMHPKTRYNIKVAQRHGIRVEERTDDKAFRVYLKLYFDTTKRQGYHGHNRQYHTQIWQTLKAAKMARLLMASKGKKPLTAWMLLNFKDTLYYPYGGSSDELRNTMHSTLVGWEAIKLGQRLKLKQFDMWGALGENPNPNDPWIGFHRFKSGFGGVLVEYIGSFDLVFNQNIYWIFTSIDKFTQLKVFLLKLINR